MADGDYERGRNREISAIAARLKRLAASRPNLLVLNGWAASPHAWDLCRFIGRNNCRLLSYIEQLDFEIPKFEIRNPNSIIVGWSMGGSMALRLACEHPEKVAGLVLVAATPRMMEADGWHGMSARRLEALRRGIELTNGQGFFGVPEGKPNPYMMDTSENLEAGLKYLLDTDIRADLERVFSDGAHKFPVYIFQSERDGIVRAENAAYLKTIFPHAYVTMVPGAEHALPIQIPKEIDDAVDACFAVAAKG